MRKALLAIIIFLVILSGCRHEQLSPGSDDGTISPEGIKIHEIQGFSHRSPLEGETVTNVYGIVTALRGDGFYLQDPHPDAEIGTSEAIFVQIRGVPRMKSGDGILVKNAVVKEFNPAGIGENSLTITQLVSANYEVVSSGNALPEAIIIGKEGRQPPDKVIDDDIIGYAGRNGSFDPATDGLDFYESLESMLVRVDNAVAVSATSSYNEIALVSDSKQLGGVYSPRGAIILQQDDANPERVILDDALVMLPKVQVGDSFNESIIGIMDYTFGSFKLQPLKPPKTTTGNLPKETLEASISEHALTVATYNIENFNSLVNPAQLQILAAHIVENLNAPDILGLQEVQDNDGEVDSQVVSADQTYKSIIDAIKAVGGPDYSFANIDPKRNMDGGVPGGNIRVGLLYRIDRGLRLVSGEPGDAETPVQVLSDGAFPRLSVNPGRIDPMSYAFQQSRKPLASMFEFNNHYLYVIVNHLNSKGGDGALFGDIQPPNLESEQQRINQAKLINNFVKDILAVNPQSMVIVMGDLNDFPWSEPIKTLAGKELTDLVSWLPLEEQYTYIYEGNAQVLDHILVSQALESRVQLVDVVHLNCEYYYKDRLSDHDPVVVVFDLH